MTAGRNGGSVRCSAGRHLDAPVLALKLHGYGPSAERRAEVREEPSLNRNRNLKESQLHVR